MTTKTDRYGEHLSIKDARSIASAYGLNNNILSRDNNTKLNKSTGRTAGYLNASLALAPDKSSGKYNTCPNSTPECREHCLGVSAGFNTFPNVQEGHKRRTNLLFEQPRAFIRLLRRDLHNFNKYCNKHNMSGVVRLNTYSDIVWERKFPAIFEEFDDLQFYDYTKIHQRGPMYEANPADWPVNYHLTLSYTGYNWDVCQERLEWGENVAVVFKDAAAKGLPEKWGLGDKKYEVVNGEQDDYRFLDKPGCIVGLIPKGVDKEARNSGPFFADHNPNTQLTVLNNYYKETK